MKMKRATGLPNNPAEGLADMVPSPPGKTIQKEAGSRPMPAPVLIPSGCSPVPARHRETRGQQGHDQLFAVVFLTISRKKDILTIL